MLILLTFLAFTIRTVVVFLFFFYFSRKKEEKRKINPNIAIYHVVLEVELSLVVHNYK